MPGTEKLRVLIAEDNPGDIALLGHILTDFAVDLRHVASLEELKEKARSWDPEVVLLDLHLEDSQDFMVTARTVVQMFPHLPVLAFTSLEGEEFALRALQAGIAAYLIKGTVSGSDLMRVIREAQARKRAQHLSVSGLNMDQFQKMVKAAVNEALTAPEPEPDPEESKSSTRAIVAIVITLVGLLLGSGAWGYNEISKVRQEKKERETSPEEKRDDLFLEFQNLRKAHLEAVMRWEDGGEIGPKPKKPTRLIELERVLAQ